MTKTPDQRRDQPREMPLQTRLLPIASVDAQARTVELVWTTGARVRRYDWWEDRYYFEELDVTPESCDLTRLNTGAPFLDSHNQYRLEAVLGVVERAWIENGEGRAIVKVSARADVEPIWQDIQASILRNVSVGYIVNRWMVIEGEAELPIYRAVGWQPTELSLVPIGADAGAGLRSAPDTNVRTYPCEFQRASADVSTGQRTHPAAAAATNPEGVEMNDRTKPAADDNAAPDAEAIRQQAVEAERGRCLQIRADVRALGFEETLAEDFIKRGLSIDQVGRELINKLAERSAQNPTRGAADIQTVQDETDMRRNLMAEAIVHRINPRGQLSEGAREYRHLSLIRMAEESLSAAGVKVRGMPALEVAARAMQTTSDFPAILANVLNKRLRQSYEENQPSYRIWARRAPNAPDFKSMSVAQLSGAPDLLKVNESGEFKYGALTDGKETYGVLTYGRVISITRQAIIDDDLRAFDRIVTAFGGAANRLENRTVYAQLTANAAMADGTALFHGDHGNLAAAGAKIDATTLAAGRTAMRLQKGLQSEELNIAPAYLIVPATQEQLAYQYTSSNYVPAKQSDVNEFRSGGRTALEPVVDAVLDAADTKAWYLAADANGGAVDTVEYCYLDGSEGVYLETGIDFDIDGMKVKARLDFAAKAIDHRGLYKNPGA